MKIRSHFKPNKCRNTKIKEVKSVSTYSFLSLYPLRHALDIREHYERKLERANNLYMELNGIMLQLEIKEKELLRYDNC